MVGAPPNAKANGSDEFGFRWGEGLGPVQVFPVKEGVRLRGLGVGPEGVVASPVGLDPGSTIGVTTSPTTTAVGGQLKPSSSSKPGSKLGLGDGSDDLGRGMGSFGAAEADPVFK